MLKIHGDQKMCRPEDRRNERIVSTHMAAIYRLKVVPQSDECCYDFLLTTNDGKPVAVVEVKTRNMYWGQYDDLAVSYKKLEECLEVSTSLGVPFVFVVMCETGIFESQINTLEGLKTSIGGRTDRLHLGIKTDVEKRAHIPNKLFRKIK